MFIVILTPYLLQYTLTLSLSLSLSLSLYTHITRNLLSSWKQRTPGTKALNITVQQQIPTQYNA